MHILFVTPFYEPAWTYGGIVRSCSGWARALVSAGVDVSVYTTTANGNCELNIPTGIPVDHDGVKVTYFPYYRKPGNGFVSPKLLYSCLSDVRDYDIIHSIGLWTAPSIISSWAASIYHKPYIVSLHGMLMPWAIHHGSRLKKYFFAMFEKSRLTRARRVICSSEMEKDKLKQIISNNHVYILPNVVNVDDVKPNPQGFRDRYNLQGAFIILFAGRLVENKGLHKTLDAFGKITREHPDARLVVVGPTEDNSEAHIKQKVELLGLHDRVCFTGLLMGNDYWDAVASANIFILNSYSENFGLAPAEALALGVPVLISDQVGIADLVSNYNAGWVASLDVDAITEKLSLALSQRDNLYEMGRRGKQLVHDHFSPYMVGKRFAQLLEDIIHEYRR